MYEQLQQLFAETLRCEMPSLSPTMTFATLPGWDSVAHLALLLAVERTFGVAFTSAQMVSMKTVGDLVEILQS